MKTRAFKSADGRRAVHLPDDFAAGEAELEITRNGRTLIIELAADTGSLKDSMARLSALPKPSSPWIAERIEMPERGWKV